jgi:hypothetical protein
VNLFDNEYKYDLGAVYKLIPRKEHLIFRGTNASHNIFEFYEDGTKYHIPRGKQHLWIYKAVNQRLADPLELCLR